MKASKRKKISCMLLIGLMFIGLLSFKNIYAEGESETPVTAGEVGSGGTIETTESGFTNEGGNETKKASVTFAFPKDHALSKISGFPETIIIDLYKVAAITWNGSDAKYEFTAEAGFENAITIGDPPSKVDFNGMKYNQDATEGKEKTDTDTLKTVTNQCIEVVQSGATLHNSGGLGKPIEVDKDGLYVAIIRNTDDDYIEKNLDNNYVSKAVITGTDNLALFTPNLIFVVEDTMLVELKPAVTPCLKIKKTISEYSGKPVTFVFEIKYNNQIIDYVSLTFSEHTTLETVAIRLPVETVGKKVTVNEIYTGASYVLDTSKGPETISVENPNIFEFANRTTDIHKHGYGFQNTYTKKTETTWDCVKEGE